MLAAIVGWCRFWCTPIDALYTKIVGVVLLLSSTASFLSLALAAARESGVSFEPGGWIGDQLAGALAASFNRTGSLIIILTALGLSLVLTTQFSFGRVFAAISGWLRERVSARVAAFWNWREERRRDRQRREIVSKHAKRAAAQADPARAVRPQAGGGGFDLDLRRPSGPPARAAEPKAPPPDRTAAAGGSGWLSPRKDPAIKVPAPPTPPAGRQQPSRPPRRSAGASPFLPSRCWTRRAPSGRSTNAS